LGATASKQSEREWKAAASLTCGGFDQVILKRWT
jgi:hypothetical protein